MKTIWKIKKGLKDILSRERGTIHKEAGGRLRVALVYPNTYRAGMSNLGFQTVYRLLNERADTVCERAFLPEKKTLEEMERSRTPLLTLESQTPVDRFHVVAFSVSFEEDYINVLRLLELSRIPLYSKERTDRPLIVAGGCAPSLNPEPLSEFMDIFFIGEAEERLTDLMDTVIATLDMDKEEALRRLTTVESVYVPSFYRFHFKDERVESIEALAPARMPVRRAMVKDVDSYLPSTALFTPLTEFGNTLLVEVERGCPRGCRFCAAGFLYLPPRWRKKALVEECIEHIPEDISRVGLVGSAVSEYPALKEILKRFSDRVDITLSSLRLDVLDDELLRLLKASGYTTITVAPEAGSERLRRIINKPLGDEEIIRGFEMIQEAGFHRLKLYFMIGLPEETDEDILSMAALVRRAREILKGGHITVSVTPFVPKPLTPFQWHRFEHTDVLKARYRLLKKTLSGTKGVEIKPISMDASLVQAYLSRADRRASGVLTLALETGWKKALKEYKDFIEASIHRQRDYEEPLPWDTIDSGIRKLYLWEEYTRALEEKTTPPCRPEVCTRCGVC